MGRRWKNPFVSTGLWGVAIMERGTYPPKTLLATLRQPPRNGARGDGARSLLLVCDSLCARYVGLSHERAGAPAGASRRGHGVAPVLDREWIGEMEYIRINALVKRQRKITISRAV